MSDRSENMKKCAMERQKKLSDWRAERNEVVLSLDPTRFRAFYKKWQDEGIYNSIPLPDDSIIEITLRKMLVNMSDVPEDAYNDAKKWLLERGYDLEI